MHDKLVLKAGRYKPYCTSIISVHSSQTANRSISKTNIRMHELNETSPMKHQHTEAPSSSTRVHKLAHTTSKL